eukprot:TRINITY_DN15785_c0_g1_i4.p1 TRINITY_DN15785_c0_g1~~TRINITY_DN15785_c0_g1_i4.p1  ORF type:complete len:343 (-),score=68.07 TRINITY_DN15785_c0_g1_i4:36-1064(-)
MRMSGFKDCVSSSVGLEKFKGLADGGARSLACSGSVKHSISKAYALAMKALQNRIKQLESENAELARRAAESSEQQRAKVLTELNHQRQVQWKINEVLELENKQLKEEVFYLKEENEQLKVQIQRLHKDNYTAKQVNDPKMESREKTERVRAENIELKKKLEDMSVKHEVKLQLLGEELQKAYGKLKKNCAPRVNATTPREEQKTKIESLKNRHLKCIQPALDLNLSANKKNSSMRKKTKRSNKKQKTARSTSKSSYLNTNGKHSEGSALKRRNHSTRTSALDNIRPKNDNSAASLETIPYTKPDSLPQSIDLQKIVELMGSWNKGKAVSYTHLTLPTICSV